MTEQTGYGQAIIDQTEIDIHRDHQELNENLEVISQRLTEEKGRAIALKTAEPYLDGQEYDLARLTAEINAQVGFITSAYVEIGRKLLAIKAIEGHGNFIKWLKANFPLSQRQAQRFMQVALKLEQAPELRALAKGGISKALCLLDLPEEDLEEFAEEGTIYGKPLEDWQLKSSKELAAELEKERKNRKKIVAEETKGLTAERDALQRRCAELEKFAPVEEATPDWCLQKMKELAKAVFNVVVLKKQFLYDDRLKGDLPTQAKIEAELSWMRKELNQLELEWNRTFNCDM